MMTATDRYGNEFRVGDIVQMKDFPVLYKSMQDKPLEITKIEEVLHCESGFNVLVKCLESGTEFKKPLDTNWFQKIKPFILDRYNNKKVS